MSGRRADAVSYMEKEQPSFTIVEKLVAALLLWKPSNPTMFLQGALSELVQQASKGTALDISSEVFASLSKAKMASPLPPLAQGKTSPRQSVTDGSKSEDKRLVQELETECVQLRTRLAEKEALEEECRVLRAAVEEVNAFKAKYEVNVKEKERAEVECSALREAKNGIEAENAQLKAALKEKERLEAEMEELRNSLKVAEEDRDASKRRVDEVGAEAMVVAEGLKKRLDEKEYEVAKLSEELRAAKAALDSEKEREMQSSFADAGALPSNLEQAGEDSDQSEEKGRAGKGDKDGKSVSFAVADGDQKHDSGRRTESASRGGERSMSAGSSNRRVYTPNGARRKTYRTDSARSALSTWRSFASLPDYEEEMEFPFEDNIFALNDRYCFVQRIATNVDAVVYKATDRTTKEHVVIKIVDGFTQGQTPLEIQIIKDVQQHQYIPSLLAWFPLPRRSCYALVQSYYHGDAIDPLDRDAIRTCIEHVLQALQHIHSKNILHRDVKPGNILYDARKKRAMLIDYDCATYYDPARPPASMIGTEGYMAPEVLATASRDASSDDGEKEGYSFPIDVFSVGVVLAELLLDLEEYGEASCDELLSMLSSVEGDDDAHELARLMLEPDVSSRITIEDALRHPFFTGEERRVMVSSTLDDQTSGEKSLEIERKPDQKSDSGDEVDSKQSSDSDRDANANQEGDGENLHSSRTSESDQESAVNQNPSGDQQLNSNNSDQMSNSLMSSRDFEADTTNP